MSDLPDRIRAAAARPTTPPDVDALWQVGRRRRGARWVTAGLGVVAVALVLVAVRPPTPAPIPIIEEPPTATASPAVTVGRDDLPAGWQEVRVGRASLGVPADWTVDTRSPNDVAPCPTAADTPTVWVGPDGFAQNQAPDCVAGEGTSPSLVATTSTDAARSYWLVPAAALLAWEPTTVAGLPAMVVGALDQYAIEQADLHLRFGATPVDLRDRILATIVATDPVPVEVALSTPLPEGWQEIEVGGLVVGVPGDWARAEVPFGEVACTNRYDRPTVAVVLAPADADIGRGDCAETPPTAPTLYLAAVDDLGLYESNDLDTSASPVGDLLAQRVEEAASVLYRFPGLDASLRFDAFELGEVAIDAVLATVRTGSGEAPPDNCPYVAGANAAVEFVDLLYLDGDVYLGTPVEVPEARTGGLMGTTGCTLARVPDGVRDPRDSDTTLLPEGRPIRAIDGVSTAWRVAVDGRVYEVISNDLVGTAADLYGDLTNAQSLTVSRSECTPVSCPEPMSATTSDPEDVQRALDLFLMSETVPRFQPGNIGAATVYVLAFDLGDDLPPLTVRVAAEYAYVSQPELVVPLALVDMASDLIGDQRQTAGIDHECPPNDPRGGAVDLVTVFGRQYLVVGGDEGVRPLAEAGPPIGLTLCRTTGLPIRDLDATGLPVRSELVWARNEDPGQVIAVVEPTQLRLYRAVTP